MRLLVFVFILLLFPLTTHAFEAPAAQTVIDGSKVLRGRFINEHQMGNTQRPMLSTGVFVVAPGHGLIWGMEKPVMTATIITPQAAVQNFGGIILKLPAKNLRHLYDMVGGALAGDWQELGNDFDIKENAGGASWQRTLTPRVDGKSKLTYTSIVVTGGHYVESITLNRADTGYDKFTFTDEALAPSPPTPQELAYFNQVPHP